MQNFETARGTVHAWQCDHMGHANLRAYGEFFEQALWHVFQKIGITPSVLRGDTIRMAGVQQNINYRKELLPGDLIVVRSGLVCELTAVCIDAQTRKPRSFPLEVAARAKEIL
jgi:acyl-CoA thioester hydrolase